MMTMMYIVEQATHLIPYATRRDDVAVIIIFVGFLLLGTVMGSVKRFLFEMMNNFVKNRERISIFNTSTLPEKYQLFILIVITCLFAGICLFDLCIRFSPQLLEHLPSPILIGIYIGFIVLYLFIKWAFYHFLGWIFLDKETTNKCMEAYLTLIYHSCFYFLLQTMLQIYLNLPLWVCFALYLLGFLIIRIFIFFKWIKLFSVKFYGLFRLFLYFCALEIVPLVLFGASVQIFNELLNS